MFDSLAGALVQSSHRRFCYNIFWAGRGENRTENLISGSHSAAELVFDFILVLLYLDLKLFSAIHLLAKQNDFSFCFPRIWRFAEKKGNLHFCE